MNGPEKDKLVAGGIVTATAVLLGAYVVGFDQSKEIVHSAAKDVGLAEEDTIPNSTVMEVIPSDCVDMRNLSVADKVGTLVIPMALPSEIEELRQSMLSLHVNNFTLRTEENNRLIDSVSLDGQSVPFAAAMNTLITQVQSQNGLEVSFALDEEGGIVQRTETLSGFSDLPSAQDQAGMPYEDIRLMYAQHGNNLLGLGVDLVFAPVADVGQAGAISSRSYGSDPYEVAARTGAVVQGYHDAGIRTTAKHVPGLGSVSEDTHNSAGTTRPLSELEKTEIPVFQHLASLGTENMMVSHASTPGLTAEGEPASLSSSTYEYIRQRLGYKGVIMTDALDMTPVQQYLQSPDLITAQADGAVMAINAGADMVIVDLQATAQVTQAIAAEVGAERIDEASARVLEVNKHGYEACGYVF